MARIEIKDLPKNMKIAKSEMEKTFGGKVVSKYIGETEKSLLRTRELDIRSSFRFFRPSPGGSEAEEHFFD